MQRARIAVFGSFYRGYFLLHECLHGESSRLVQVVGVATDDPTQPYVSPGRRVWAYPHEKFEETMVAELAHRSGLPVYTGRVKTPEFRRMFREQWRPDIVVSGTFGQLFDEALYGFPRLGFFNLHPCAGSEWPSPYAGPNPFQALIDDGAQAVNVALHEVNGEFDAGRLIALSEQIPIPPGVGVTDLHKITSPVTARFFARELAGIVGAASAATNADRPPVP